MKTMELNNKVLAYLYNMDSGRVDSYLTKGGDNNLADLVRLDLGINHKTIDDFYLTTFIVRNFLQVMCLQTQKEDVYDYFFFARRIIVNYLSDFEEDKKFSCEDIKKAAFAALEHESLSTQNVDDNWSYIAAWNWRGKRITVWGCLDKFNGIHYDVCVNEKIL